MTDISKINKLFETAIAQPGIHHKLGITAKSVRMMRYNYKRWGRVRIERRVWVLQQLGINIEAYQYTKKDMVDLLNYYQRCSHAARELGNEYVVEKFINAERKLSGPARG
jgi:hypothetical protein